MHRQGWHFKAKRCGRRSSFPGAPSMALVVCAGARRSGRSRNCQISPALGPAHEEAEAAPAPCCVCTEDGLSQTAAEGGPMLRCISCPAACHDRCAPEGCCSQWGRWCCAECSAVVEQAEMTHGAALRWAAPRLSLCCAQNRAACRLAGALSLEGPLAACQSHACATAEDRAALTQHKQAWHHALEPNVGLCGHAGPGADQAAHTGRPLSQRQGM